MGALDYTIRTIEEINDRQGRAEFFGELAVLRSLRERSERRYYLICLNGDRHEKTANSKNILHDALLERERVNSDKNPYIAIEIKGAIVYQYDMDVVKDELLAYVQRKQLELAEAIESERRCRNSGYEDHAELWADDIKKLNKELQTIKNYEIWKN